MDFKSLFERMKAEAAEKRQKAHKAMEETNKRTLELMESLQSFIQGSMAGPTIKRQDQTVTVTHRGDTISITTVDPANFHVLVSGQGAVLDKGKNVSMDNMMREVLIFLCREQVL